MGGYLKSRKLYIHLVFGSSPPTEQLLPAELCPPEPVQDELERYGDVPRQALPADDQPERFRDLQPACFRPPPAPKVVDLNIHKFVGQYPATNIF